MNPEPNRAAGSRRLARLVRRLQFWKYRRWLVESEEAVALLNERIRERSEALEEAWTIINILNTGEMDRGESWPRANFWLRDNERHAPKGILPNDQVKMRRADVESNQTPSSAADAPTCSSSFWQPMETAPRDGTSIVGKYPDTECMIRWSDRPVCMLGPINGGYPAGWATDGSETDRNLPMDTPEAWMDESDFLPND